MIFTAGCGVKESGRRKKRCERRLTDMTKEQLAEGIRLVASAIAVRGTDEALQEVGRLIVRIRKAVRSGALKHHVVYWVLQDLHDAQRLLRLGDATTALLYIQSAARWWHTYGG